MRRRSSYRTPAMVEALEPRQLLASVAPDVNGLPAVPVATAVASVGAEYQPHLLLTQGDLDRMRAKVSAGASPWIDSWNLLLANPHAQLTWTAQPVAVLIRGTTPNGSENYSKAMNDAAAAYQLALRWEISGDTRYADKAVEVLNAWGHTLTDIDGDTNQFLAAGLYGYQFAIAAEIMRSYSGWAAADVTQFQAMMRNVFYSHNLDFLTRHNGTPNDHYWANWDLCNIASVIAIGVLVDDKSIYDYGINYFKTGVGNGDINNAVYYMHPGKLGQYQESGRDQGHSLLGIPLLGTIAQMAWNQGDDLYSYNDNAILAISEYIAKYNLGYDVPYVTYINSDVVQSTISAGSRGGIRPGFELIYNHYVNLEGIAAPYTAQYAALVRAEGGGGDYGTTSGGFDQLGFGTLTSTLDPIATGARPSGLVATAKGSSIELSWWGSAYATSYTVRRATSAAGPYTTIATNVTGPTTYTDTGAVPGTTYYYVISAVSPSGESAYSDSVSAVSNQRLQGAIIGSPGSFGGKGATIATVFDGTIRNFYDAQNTSGDWAGMDFGEGVADAITMVKYAPRKGFASRMVGGQFQGSNDPTFASGVVTLYTIRTAPPEGVMSSVTITSSTPFRYVRYLGPAGGSCNVAEVELYGYNVASAVPAVPPGLTASAGTAGVSLTWNAATGATGYDVRRATISGGPYTTIATGVNLSSFTDTSAADATTYYYVISARNAAGSSANSSQVSARTLTPPTGLAVVAAGLAKLNLSWTGAPDAASYLVKRSTTPTGPYTVIATVSDTTYADGNIVQRRPYYYVVSAVNDGGESRNSIEVTGTGTATKLTGTIIGTSGSWGSNPQTTKNAALDGDISTAFDAPIATGGWVGLDLGAAAVVTSVRYYPRAGNAIRMLNGVFQGSNSANFSNAVTLCAITTTPSYAYTTLDVNNATAYRYVRYLGPTGGYCNVAEIEFYTSNATPTVAAPAVASPNPVSGTTANLSVLGRDDGGEANLTYTWSAAGPSGVSYSVNGTNAAKNMIATFSQSGSYSFTVTITDTGGLSTTSSVSVSVTQMLSAISVSPAAASVVWGQSQQFAASGYDQFGAALATSFNWSTTAGTIDASGLLLASGAAGTYQVTASSGGLSGSASCTIQAVVTGRWLFYNNSYFDGSNAAANTADDGAVATDKQALLPGQTARFANYSSYSRGINGVMVDVGGLSAAGVDLTDLSFAVGNSSTPANWSSAPAPQSLTIRRRAGVNGSDRIELVWADNVIQKQWLQITVQGNAHSGLAQADLFYFGNAIGESGNSPSDTVVDATDELGARNHPRGSRNRAPIDFAWDYNRDGLVDATDELIARNNAVGSRSSLRLLVAPVPAGGTSSLLAAPSTAAALLQSDSGSVLGEGPWPRGAGVR